MADAVVGTLKIIFDANAQKLAIEFDKAGASVDQFEGKVKEAKKSSDDAAAGILNLGSVVSKLGPYITAAAVGKLVGDFVDVAGALVDLEAKTGIGVRGLQKIKGATQESGVELETMAKVALSLQKRIGDGKDSFVGALERVGLEYKNIRELSPEDALFAVGDAIGTITDQNEKVALTNELLGKVGTEALPALTGHLKETADAFERMGLVIDDDVIRSGDALGDQWTVLKSTGSALLAQVIGPLLPAVVGLTGGLLSLGNASAPVIKFLLELVGMPFEKTIHLVRDLGAAFDLLTLKAEKLANLPKPPDLTSALVPPGGLKMLELDEVLEISDALTESAKERIEENKKAAAALEREVEAAKRLRDVWSGANAFNEAKKLTKQIEELGGAVKLTEEEQKRALATLQAAIDKYDALGQSAPQDVLMTTIQLDAMITRLKDARTHVELLGLQFDESLPQAPLATGKFDPMATLEPFKAPAVAQGVGVSLGKSIVGGIGDTFRTELGPTIMAAITGGGNIGQAVGGLLGQSITGSLSQWLTKAAPQFMSSLFGQVVGSFLPGIGALLGPALGKITDWFKGLFGVSKEVREARGALEDFQKTLRAGLTDTQKLEAGTDAWRQDVVRVRDAFIATGRSEAEALAIVRQLWDTDHPDRMRAAIDEINRVLEEEKRLADDAAESIERQEQAFADAKEEAEGLIGEMDGLVEKAGSLDKSMIPYIDKMREAGLISEETAQRLKGMVGAVDWERAKSLADKFGISIDSLGPRFQGARLGATAKEMIDSFAFLRSIGTDAGTILHGMRDEISKLVVDSRRFGTEIPANMKPWIINLMETDQLLDDQGEKITDLKGIRFGPEVKSEAEVAKEGFAAMMLKIDELISKITGPLVTALDKLTEDRTINVKIDYEFGEPPIPRAGLERNIPMDIPGLAMGGIVKRPTLAMIGEKGPEAVIPLPPSFDIPIPRGPMIDAPTFDRSDRGGRQPGDTTTNMPMLVIQNDRPLPELLERVKAFLASPQGIMSNDFGIRERIDELADAAVERGLQRRFANAT